MDIEKLKQKILDLAIRGQLVPQDPNDESASVLIEKIKKEKEELVKQGKIKASKNESYIYKGADNYYYEKTGNKKNKIDVAFEIPDSWNWCKLGEIFEIGSSKRIHKSDWKPNGIPFYRARDVELLNDDIFKSDIYISTSLYEEIKNKYGIPNINDILVSAVGTLGKTFVVKNGDPFYYKDGNIIILKNIFNINPYYIQMLFSSSFLLNQIKGDSKGTTVDTYTIEHANETLIPLPPLSMQDKIVKMYISAKKYIDKINNERNSLDSLLTKCKCEVLNYYFNENSCYKSYYENSVLNKHANIVMGQSPKSEDVSQFPLESSLEFHQGKIYFTDFEIGKSENYAKKYNKKTNGKSVLLCVRAPVGVINYCFRQIAIGRGLCSVEPFDDLNIKYLYYYLQYSYEYYINNSTGSTFSAICVDIIKNTPFKYCDIETQKNIVKKVESNLDMLNKIKEQII